MNRITCSFLSVVMLISVTWEGHYTFTKLTFILFWYHFLSVNLKFVINQHE
jgi:hypothetical protein